MNKPMKRIHNLETNEIIDREMNDEEYAQWQIDVANDKARIQVEVEAAAKKAVAEAKLAALGLTEEELKLLLS